MKEMIVEDIVQICHATLIYGKKDIVCEDFCKDTREIQKNDVYVGIKGENFNGSMLYKEALEKGASVCILEDITIDQEILKKYPDCSILIVEDSIIALQKLAQYKRSLYDIPVIAVTGSVGKTSTKDMIASVVQTKYQVLKTQGNLNNHIGLPLTILKLKDHTAMVVEMGMNAMGEIRTLTNIAKPTICVITNIGTAHIGKLGSRENILKAKLEILEGMQKQGIVVINNDNDLLHDWKEKNTKYCVKTFGSENQSDIMAKDIILEEHTSKFTAYTLKSCFPVEVLVPGMHFVHNALCAATIGQLLNIDESLIIKGIKEFELTKNRMEILEAFNQAKIISDCYNASYDSTKGTLESLSKMKAKRKIAVLGDMLELGEYSKELHEKVGEEIVKNKIDILMVVGNDAKYIAKKANQMGMQKENIYIEESIQQATKDLKELLKPEDTVLIKASNGMNFKKIVEEIKK